MSTGSDRTEEKKGLGGGIFLAFIPWILFSVIAQHDTVAVAGIAAFAAALLIAVPSFAAGRPKILDIGGLVVFAAFAIAGLAAGDDADWLVEWARFSSALLLALIALGSLLIVPFTEQYARESVPREHWDSPVFKRVNRELTLMWGLVFLAMVPSHLVAIAIDTRRGDTIFNWVIPIVLIVWAVKRTGAVSEAAGRDAAAAAGAGVSRP